MEINGKILEIGSEETVNEKFTKREFVIQTDDKFPKQVCIQLVNDRDDLIDKIKIGDTVKVFYNLESKKSKDKWFTNVTAWRIEKQHYNQEPQ